MLTRVCFILILLLTTPAMAAACTCGLNAFPCGEEWKTGDVIFVGTVRSRVLLDRVAAISGPSYVVGRAVAYHFQVTETLRGPNTDGKEIVVETGEGGGDCGYRFQTGKEYVVYAHLYQNRLTTSICTATQPKQLMTGALLRQLRNLRDQRATDTLFGTIGTPPHRVRDGDVVENIMLAGVAVRLIGSNKRQYATRTDNEGIYSFGSLPPAEYRMEVDVPVNLSLPQQNPGKPFMVRVSENANLTGCRVDLVALPDGRISGKVVNLKGKGLTGFVALKPIGPTEVDPVYSGRGFPGSPTEKGAFTLWQVPPGKYRLLFYPNVGGRIILTNETSYSNVIEIGFGQHINNVHFIVSPRQSTP
jgi:hypothetical protein